MGLRVLVLVCIASAVQAAPRYSMGGDALPRPQGTVAADGFVSPPPSQLDDSSTRVIQFEKGYLSFAASADDLAERDPGQFTLSVIPAPHTPADALAEQRPPEELDSAPFTEPARSVSSSGPDQCLPNGEALAQRLMKLRGVDLEPASALLAEAALDQPWSPYLALAVFGRPEPLLGGSFLANASSWDRETQELTADLTACLGLQPIGT